MTITVSGTVQTDDRMCVLTFKARKFSPVRTIDLKKLGSNLTTLPKEMQTFLAQRFVPKGMLDNEKRIEQAARAWLSEHALNLGNGLNLLNPSSAVEGAEAFEAFSNEYAKAKAATIAEYPAKCAEAEAKLRGEFPNYAGMDQLIDALRKQVPTATELETNMSFEYQLMVMSKFESKFDPAKDPLLSKGYLSMHCGMFGKLVADVCARAWELKSDLAEGRAAADKRIKEKTFNRVKAIASKVQVLSFIDPAKAGAMSLLIENALDLFPKKFPWDEKHFDSFVEMVSRLANQTHVVKCLNSGAPLFTIAAPTPAPAPAVAAPVITPAPAVVTQTTSAPLTVNATVTSNEPTEESVPPVIPAAEAPKAAAGMFGF